MGDSADDSSCSSRSGYQYGGRRPRRWPPPPRFLSSNRHAPASSGPGSSSGYTSDTVIPLALDRSWPNAFPRSACASYGTYARRRPRRQVRSSQSIAHEYQNASDVSAGGRYARPGCAGLTDTTRSQSTATLTDGTDSGHQGPGGGGGAGSESGTFMSLSITGDIDFESGGSRAHPSQQQQQQQQEEEEEQEQQQGDQQEELEDFASFSRNCPPSHSSRRLLNVAHLDFVFSFLCFKPVQLALPLCLLFNLSFACSAIKFSIIPPFRNSIFSRSF